MWSVLNVWTACMIVRSILTCTRSTLYIINVLWCILLLLVSCLGALQVKQLLPTTYYHAVNASSGLLLIQKHRSVVPLKSILTLGEAQLKMMLCMWIVHESGLEFQKHRCLNKNTRIVPTDLSLHDERVKIPIETDAADSEFLLRHHQRWRPSREFESS